MQAHMQAPTRKPVNRKPEVGLPPPCHLLLLLCSISILAGCTAGDFSRSGLEKSNIDQPETWQMHLKPIELPAGTGLAYKETIYLPVYSHIYGQDHEDLKINLAETVSIRNTDFNEPIILISVRHYKTDGGLVKEYIRKPLLVNPMATADFVVPREDETGGSGANFIIEWVSKAKVTKPITESIMIFAGSSHSVSFLSRGVVIKESQNTVVSEEDAAKWIVSNPIK